MVPSPLIDHAQVNPAGPLYVLPVELAHTASGPVIKHDGKAFTVTVFVLVDEHPVALVVVNVRVNVPGLPAVTITEEPVLVELTMVPFPLILHKQVNPDGPVYVLLIEPEQTEPDPVMVDDGLVLTVTV